MTWAIKEQGKHVSVSMNHDFIEITTMSGHGIVFVDQDYSSEFLSRNSSALELGQALRKCLQRSKVIPLKKLETDYSVPKILEYAKQKSADIMEKYGYQSEREMGRYLIHVSVTNKDGNIVLMSSNMDGLNSFSRRRDDGLGEDVVVSSDVTDEQLGEALLLALSRATIKRKPNPHFKDGVVQSIGANKKRSST